MSAGLLESARNLLTGILELGRTRFELFGTELREELARLSGVILAGLAVLILAALALVLGAGALILHVDEARRPAVAAGIAIFFALAAGIVAWRLHRTLKSKPQVFDATLAELQRDLETLRK
jgi:uncharacterized membrane protein YqjE